MPLAGPQGYLHPSRSDAARNYGAWAATDPRNWTMSTLCNSRFEVVHDACCSGPGQHCYGSRQADPYASSDVEVEVANLQLMSGLVGQSVMLDTHAGSDSFPLPPNGLFNLGPTDGPTARFFPAGLDIDSGCADAFQYFSATCSQFSLFLATEVAIPDDQTYMLAGMVSSLIAFAERIVAGDDWLLRYQSSSGAGPFGGRIN